MKLKQIFPNRLPLTPLFMPQGPFADVVRSNVGTILSMSLRHKDMPELP
jgi:hypothetical protein